MKREQTEGCKGQGRREQVRGVTAQLGSLAERLHVECSDNKRLALGCITVLIELEDILTSDAIDGLRDAQRYLLNDVERAEKAEASPDDESLERILGTAEGIAEQLQEAAGITL